MLNVGSSLSQHYSLGVSELVSSPAQAASPDTSLPSTSSSKGRARKRKGDEVQAEAESVAKKVNWMIYLKINPVIYMFSY